MAPLKALTLDVELEQATGARALRVENLKLKDENRRLKERLRSGLGGGKPMGKHHGKSKRRGSQGPRMAAQHMANGHGEHRGLGNNEHGARLLADEEFSRRLTPPSLRRLDRLLLDPISDYPSILHESPPTFYVPTR